jgi:hypothetical protein
MEAPAVADVILGVAPARMHCEARRVVRLAGDHDERELVGTERAVRDAVRRRDDSVRRDERAAARADLGEPGHRLRRDRLTPITAPAGAAPTHAPRTATTAMVRLT